MSNYYQGHYKPKNINKYIGNISNICYRSSWELSLMHYFDNSTKILKWSSEEIIIPYISPLDNKQHRYFLDLYAELNNKKYYIEVKPLKQTIEPKPSKRISKKYLTEVSTYIINQAKWNAASLYAKQRGGEFIVFTEKTIRELGIKI